MRTLTQKQKEILKKHNFKNIKKDKLKKIVKKGNQASIEKRQELKTIKDIIKTIAQHQTIKTAQKNKLLTFGLTDNLKNYAFFVLLDKALNKGNLQALNKLLNYFERYEKGTSADTEKTINNFMELLNETAPKDWQ